ncbi:MAG: hypothetical protein QM730_08540 [Anaerolineales bacterium]
MRKFLLSALTLFSLLLSSCATSTPPPPTPVVVSVYSTAAAETWLSELYTCGAERNATLSRVDDPSTADISLRVGEPQVLTVPAFQIDTEEILIVTHRQSPIQNLTLEQAQVLFSQGDPSVQVWVYAPDADVQQVFNQAVMAGRSVVSSAMIAVNPQQMSDTLNNQVNTVGILPKHWKVGDSRFVYSIPNIPVLALTKSEPQGVIKELIGCLQK